MITNNKVFSTMNKKLLVIMMGMGFGVPLYCAQDPAQAALNDEKKMKQEDVAAQKHADKMAGLMMDVAAKEIAAGKASIESVMRAAGVSEAEIYQTRDNIMSLAMQQNAAKYTQLKQIVVEDGGNASEQTAAKNMTPMEFKERVLEASKNNLLDAIEECVAAHPDWTFNFRDKDGRTPLMLALRRYLDTNHGITLEKSVFKYLVDNAESLRINFNTLDCAGNTVAHIAVLLNKDDVLDILKNTPTDFTKANPTARRTPLDMAIERGLLVSAKWLFKYYHKKYSNFDFFALRIDNNGLLHRAITSKQMAMLELVTDECCSAIADRESNFTRDHFFNLVNDAGLTPLQLARSRGQEDMVTYLKEYVGSDAARQLPMMQQVQNTANQRAPEQQERSENKVHATATQQRLREKLKAKQQQEPLLKRPASACASTPIVFHQASETVKKKKKKGPKKTQCELDQERAEKNRQKEQLIYTQEAAATITTMKNIMCEREAERKKQQAVAGAAQEAVGDILMQAAMQIVQIEQEQKRTLSLNRSAEVAEQTRQAVIEEEDGMQAAQVLPTLATSMEYEIDDQPEYDRAERYAKVKERKEKEEETRKEQQKKLQAEQEKEEMRLRELQLIQEIAIRSSAMHSANNLTMQALMHAQIEAHHAQHQAQQQGEQNVKDRTYYDQQRVNLQRTHAKKLAKQKESYEKQQALAEQQVAAQSEQWEKERAAYEQKLAALKQAHAEQLEKQNADDAQQQVLVNQQVAVQSEQWEKERASYRQELAALKQAHAQQLAMQQACYDQQQALAYKRKKEASMQFLAQQQETIKQLCAAGYPAEDYLYKVAGDGIDFHLPGHILSSLQLQGEPTIPQIIACTPVRDAQGVARLVSNNAEMVPNNTQMYNEQKQ